VCIWFGACVPNFAIIFLPIEEGFLFKSKHKTQLSYDVFIIIRRHVSALTMGHLQVTRHMRILRILYSVFY